MANTASLPRAPSPPLYLLLLLLTTSPFLALPHTQAQECRKAENSATDPSAAVPLDHLATSSLRITGPIAGTKWNTAFEIGNRNGEDFTSIFQLEMKKAKGFAYSQQIKLVETEKQKALINQKVKSAWLNMGSTAILYIKDTTINLEFQSGDDEGRKLLMTLTDPMIQGLNAVLINGDLQVEACQGPELIPDTTTPTTTSTTTTTTTTTASTTTVPTTTTTPSTTTTPTTTTTTTTTPITTTTTQDENSMESTTTMDVSYKCPPMEGSERVTVASTIAANGSVLAVSKDQECKFEMRLVYILGALAVAFFLFILVLIAYTIALYKRSWKTEKPLTANSSGGFGMSAEDMYYYEMKNTNLMIGNTVPRIKTPRGSPVPGVTPSHSTSRLSESYPSTLPLTGNTLNVPDIQLGGINGDIVIDRNSKTSKVYFTNE